MNAFRTILTVSDPRQVIVKDVPFSTGQQVEVILLPTESSNNPESAKQLRELLKATQSLPQIQTLTDAEIEAEIAAYRSGR